MIDVDVVAISPHPDDVELACWPWLVRARARGRLVVVALLASDDRARTAETIAACRRADLEFWDLGAVDGRVGELESRSNLVQTLDHLVDYVGDPLVLAPHPDDSHQDHRAAAELALAASRRGRAGLAWYGTVSTGPTWIPNLLLELDDAAVSSRRDALDAHRSQASRDYLGDPHLETRDRWLGQLVDVPRATGLQLVRAAIRLEATV